MIADLHIHTTASDGRLSPDEVALKAIEVGLSHIAITDHDTVDGILALSQNLTTKIDIIPGIEFSTDLPHNEVHILGYYIDMTNAALRAQLKLIADDRLTRAERMVEKLAKLGYNINYSRVLEIAGDATTIGRPHVASALLEKGYFPSFQNIFDTLLAKNKPAYVPHYKLSPHNTIDLINQSGGIPVLAHPGLVGDDKIVIDLISHGIQGIEVYHPKHDSSQVIKYERLAKEQQLIITGGSDFHGIPGRFPEKLGEFTIPADLVVELQHSAHALKTAT
jgi:predicted metal-dependent phosphoesterase TrpH